MGEALRTAATAPRVQSLALLCLCAAYLDGGWHKARDFRGAVAEVTALGLTPATPIAAATLVLQIAASALILTGWYRWLGALALAGFTVLAALLANRFWAEQQAERQRAANAFFEHWGLAGGMLLVAWHDLGGSHAG